MGRKKLTLSVEERLTRRAKSIAKERGTSVSRLVETFFTALGQEGEDTSEGEGTRERGEGDSDGSSSTDYEPSDWARQWRGAFSKEGEPYPDDPRWAEEVLVEEIEKKHAS